MLDEKEQAILLYIIGECKDDYKVLYCDDFEDFFASKFGKKKFKLEQILNHLKNLHFVDIKYIDDEKCCLCATEQSKLLFEEETTKKKNNKKIRLEIVFLMIFVLIFAFVGSFLGTLLCNTIFG